MFEINELKRAEGYPVYYTDDGSGVPLLLIHGWLMSHRVWALQAALSDRFRVITLDLPGHGRSAESVFSYKACCEDIALLFDRLCLDRVILVGWSMGAQIAIKAYSGFKERIAGLVLVGGTPHFCSSSDFPYGLAPSAARSMALRLKKDYIRTCGDFFKSMFSPEEAGEIDMRSLANNVVSSLPFPGGALSALHELINSDLRADLPLISVPVMLVHGVDDKICLPGASQYMAAKIPAASLELVPSAGHAPFLTNPEAFSKVLADFAQVAHG